MMKLIVGLGNPGEKYAYTRHNLGFMAVESLGKKLGNGAWKMEDKFKSEILKQVFDGDAQTESVQDDGATLILAKPQTYMNNSGRAVKALVDYYKIDLEDLIIVYDELDLPLGKIKVRMGGSAAGHHGVESIMDYLKDDKFVRVRLGIGNQQTKESEHQGTHINVDRFVTAEFKSDEKPKVKHMLKQAVGALEIVIEKGVFEAQNQFN